jgi:DNA processing protein
LPELIASGKAGRPIRIATIEETEREIEATFKLGGRFIALCEPEYPMLLRRTDSAPPLIAVRGNLLSLQRSKIAVMPVQAIPVRTGSPRRPISRRGSPSS